MKQVFVIVLLLSLSTSVHAQKVRKLSLEYRTGWLIKHKPELSEAFADAHPRAVTFTYLTRTTGEKEWQRAWKYPDVGASITYQGYQDPRLGEVIMATLFIRKYFGPKKGPVNFSFKVSPGVSFSNEKFDENSNPDNTYISTTINGVLEGDILAHVALTKRLTAFGGFVFTHYSNGGINAPNNGFNVPTIAIGASYSPNPEDYRPVMDPLPPFVRQTRYQLMVAPSVKTISPEDDNLYFAWTVSSYASFHLSRKNALTAGLDVFYNNTIPARKGIDKSKWRVGIHAGHELIAGKNSALLQVGYYVYRPVHVDTSVYWRLGIKHHLTDWLFIGANLKAHLAKADVIEWSVGYRM